MADDLSPQDRDLITRTVLSEAGKDGDAGMAAVANVIKNRLSSGQYGGSPSEVVLAPNQFSAWSLPRTDPNNPSRWSTKNVDYQKAAGLVDSVWKGDIPDSTGGASHYLNPSIVAAQRGQLPDWAQGQPTAKIGGHAFYAPNGPVAQSQFATPSQDDIGETARALGVSAPESSASGVPRITIPRKRTAADPTPPAPAPFSNVNDEDIAATARALGIGIGGQVAKTPLPAQMQPTDLPSHLLPEQEAIAQQRAKTLGMPNAMVQGMPIVGPAMDLATSAVGAAIDPSVANSGLGYGERFVREQNINQRAQEIYNQQHPLLSTTGNLLGGALVTGPAAMTNLGGRALGTVGSTLGARFYGGAVGGAGIGGLDALLRGQDPLTGAEVGVAFGAGGPLIAEGVGGVVGAGLNAARGGQGPLADVNPIARNWLSTALANETPSSLAAAHARMGSQGFLADLNPAMTELAAGIANRPEPPASSLVGEAYRTRQAAQRGVIEDSLNRNIGNKIDIEDFKNMITENRSAASDPLYNQWRTMQVHPTQSLKDLIPRLEKVGAFDEAEFLSNATGRPMNRNFFTTGQQKDFPTTETWDLVKRGLDSKIEAAYATGNKTRAAALVGMKHELIDEIGKTPAGQVWNQARMEFADRSSLLDQIAAGQDAFLGGRSATSADELRAELRTLNGPELQARLVGLRNAADNVMGSTANGDTTLRNKFLAPNNQEKLRLMLGDQRAQTLINTMEQQHYLSGQAQYVNPRAGSATLPRGQAVAALEAPKIAPWNFKINEPLSIIPPSWVDALRPSTVLQGGRDAGYAGARQQLAPLLTQREGSGLSALIDAIRSEALSRGNAANSGAQARALSGLLISGPGAETARLRGNFSTTPALSGPLQ
jgi:Cell Wall Hydrolase